MAGHKISALKWSMDMDMTVIMAGQSVTIY